MDTTIVHNGIGNKSGGIYYGRTGFLYKKNTGVGGRRSTRFFPGGGARTCAGSVCPPKSTFFNKYKAGDTYVGAQPTAIRRAKNIRATVCGQGNQKCSESFNRLGVNKYNTIGMNQQYPQIYPIYIDQRPQLLPTNTG